MVLLEAVRQVRIETKPPFKFYERKKKTLIGENPVHVSDRKKLKNEKNNKIQKKRLTNQKGDIDYVHTQ